MVKTHQENLQAIEALTSAEYICIVAIDVRRKDKASRFFERAGRFDRLFVSVASNLSYQPLRELDLEAARKTIDAEPVAALMLANYAARQISEHSSMTFTAGIAVKC